ncbi:DapH/DapD/GlmU-related protein [Salinibacter ruber]|uniref:DapH/DapD/GlmU-related protein n=1 Tax=Salinibacter ruber TaxID=146919 RepID=UPI002168B32F|nr:DapH/DapD/GlmU-related protein [Salinibacter ruber]MCS4199760.1 acetyltransferase-like isoleucine patch superfamily enzyme [Salinibacter ruber]
MSQSSASSAWQKIRDMPWTASMELRRRLAWPLVRAQFAWQGIEWGTGWKVFGRPIIQRHRGSRIALGDGLYLRSWPRANPLSPSHPVVLSTRDADASIVIGDDCGFTGTILVAGDRIEIGDRVQVGGNASIVDTDFHPLVPEVRWEHFNAGASAPIVIKDDVFVGMEALILKGVTVGEGAVVGAGAVVTQDVPSRTVVAGNPATVVREL